MSWMAPRNGGYQPKDDGKPQGLPPKGGAGVTNPLVEGTESRRHERTTTDDPKLS